MTQRKLSRREFIRDTAGLSGAIAAGSGGPLEAGPRAHQAESPGRTVRFGIIGVGMRGSGLLRTAIQLPGVECAAACDLYSGRRELAKEIIQDSAVPITAHYQDLLSNSQLDAIIAAVPDHWHMKIVVEATNAGKDVYCEKPMSHTVEAGFQMVDAQEKNNRIVQIGSQRRSSLGFAKAHELVQQGAIGDVTLVEATLGRNDPCGAWQYTVPPDLSPETMDWDIWQAPAAKHVPFNKIRWTRWRCFQDYGEGIPGDLYVHELTGIHYVMNVQAPPARAYSMGGLFRWKDGRDVPDELATLYDYPNFRAMIRVTLNTETPELTRFYGTRGYIQLHGDGGHLTVAPQDGLDHAPCTPAWPQAMRAQYAEQWKAEHSLKPGEGKLTQVSSFENPPGFDDDAAHLWNFFQSVRTRQPSVEDARFGNNTAIACHMANYSYFHNSPAIWDEQARKINS
ncbi:MAG: Gfo/Idh/MocA family protein [Terriglobia bacterium]